MRSTVAISSSLVVLALGAGAASANPGPAPIIGGVPTTTGQYPTVVAILAGGGLCTGTLIDPEWVLTAAHCVHPDELGVADQAAVTAATTVVLDSVDVTHAGGRQIRAALTMPHPGFSPFGLGSHDIGLIKLATPVTDRDPSPINLDHERAPVGMYVTMVGYGVNQVGGQAAGVEYVLPNRASTACAPWGESDVSLLCFSQSDGAGKCNGDSGGPSFATIDGVDTVVGVTSFGDQNCTQFGADTRVDAETDWLFEQLGGILECGSDGACGARCGSFGLPVDTDCPVCVSDDDCGGGACLDNGACGPAPFSDGGLGASCATGDDCASASCASDGTDSLCTASCDGAAACPDGFSCASGGLCWPTAEDTGPCDAGGGSASLSSILFAVGALLLPRRRR